MSKMLIKKGDTVIVKSGSSANGKEPVIGKVLEVAPKEGKVIVEGAHFVKKHVKARRQGENSQIVTTEGPMYAFAATVAKHCKGGSLKNVNTCNSL